MAVRHQYRSAGHEPRTSRRLDFDKLPNAIQERLVRCLGEGAAPAPLLAETSELPAKIPGTPRLYRSLGIVAGFVEMGLWFAHFGDLESRYSIQPTWFVAGHCLAATLACLCFLVFRAFRSSKSIGAPFAAGRYLFALDMVEAEGRILTVTSLDSLRSAEVRERNGKIFLDLLFRDGETTSFRVSGEEAFATASHAQKEIEEGARLVFPDDQPKLERADPFFELRVAEDWASAEARAEKENVAPPFRTLVGVSLLAATLLGPALLLVRNWASDESMFGQVREKAETREEEAFERMAHQYHRHGWRHKADVEDVGYERAKREITSLARFLKRYPDSKYASDADDALFEKAKAAHTMEALGLYLEAAGYKHRGEADDELFAEAKRQKTSHALRQYLEHKGLRHEQQVKEELLPDAKTVEALKTRSVLTLLEIAKEHANTSWGDAAKAAVHRVYQDETSALAKQSFDSPSVRALLIALLSHADRIMDPHVRLVVRTDVSNQFAEQDGKLAREYGSKYHPTWPYLNVNELRFARGEVETAIIKAIRSRVGEALVLVPEQGDALSGEQGASKEWSSISVGLSPVMGESHFITKFEDEVFCDVRLFLSIVASVPGSYVPLLLDFTSDRADFNPNVHTVLGRMLGGTKPGDEYREMLKKAPASLAQKLEEAFRVRPY